MAAGRQRWAKPEQICSVPEGAGTGSMLALVHAADPGHRDRLLVMGGHQSDHQSTIVHRTWDEAGMGGGEGNNCLR